VTEKKPIISHSQRYFRVPFVKPGDHLNNNNTGENMKVTMVFKHLRHPVKTRYCCFKYQQQKTLENMTVSIILCVSGTGKNLMLLRSFEQQHLREHEDKHYF
jgi:hypothetical protein